MKRIIAYLSCFVLLFCCIVPANATEADPAGSILISKTTEYLENGTSIEIAVYEEPITTFASDYMKSGSKVYTARNHSGSVLYKFTVKGVFSVDEGVEAVCTSTSYSVSITDTTWSCSSASTTKSGNRAIANGTFVMKLSGIVNETDNVQVTLQCDDLGNLS